MITPLVSVIVPIYNVKPYLRKCLDSLKNQTLREIEIICIDDGSTDGSGEIADEYACDERFRVFHTENRGLSAARNRGIDESQTDWLMFVDSDDWVHEDFCRIPFEKCQEYEADLVIFRAFCVKHGKTRKTNNNILNPIIIDFDTAIGMSIYAAWGIIYAKKLFLNIRYPEGRVYEDVATTHKLLHQANRMVLLSDHLYYHVSRNKSITNTHNHQNQRDSLISNIERYEDLIRWSYPEKMARYALCSSALGYLVSVQPCNDMLYLKAKKIVDSTESFPASFPIIKKIALYIWKRNKKAFYIASVLSGRLTTLS